MQQVTFIYLLIFALNSYVNGAYPIALTLAQYGVMHGLSGGTSNVYLPAKRSPPPALLDWPNYTLALSNGTSVGLWPETSQQTIILDDYNPNTDLFQSTTDNIINPSSLWFRYISFSFQL